MTGRVIWITGLSGAGKTTTAKRLCLSLKLLGCEAIMLDGDDIREILSISGNTCHKYDSKERLALALRYSGLCKLLALQGFTVIMSTISMFQEVYDYNRVHLPNYFEIYLKVPYAELRRRDTKKIYSEFEAGNKINIMGLDLPICEPINANHTVNFESELKVETIVEQVLAKLDVKIITDRNI